MPPSASPAHPSPTALSGRDALATAFRPRSVAVAGVSVRPKSSFNGMRWFKLVRGYGIVERFYALNPRGGALRSGTPLYPSLRDVPDDQIDLVISVIPAHAVLDLLDQAAEKGVKVLHLVTAGFGETGLTERADLEAELQRRARAYGIRLLGPNCMGIHSPVGGVSWLEDADRTPGRIAMLSQSGANASEVVMRAESRGLCFSHVASYGNALDLNEADLIDYFADDPGTDIVLAYLEGIKEGRRFAPLARRLAARKPFAVLKGGGTEPGTRAVMGHTGSLAGAADVWAGVVRQTRLIDVATPDALLDLAVTAQRLAGVRGPRVALVGRGGGNAVLAADAVARAGLELPPLSEATRERLAEYLPPAGNSLRNPVDSDIAWDADGFLPALGIVGRDPGIDVVILQANVDNLPTGGVATDAGFAEGLRDRLLEARDALPVPMAVVVRAPRTPGGVDLARRIHADMGRAGVATYDSVSAAAVALRGYLDWRAATGHSPAAR